jgi:hypothetical protein
MRKIVPAVILFSLTSVFALEQTKPVERLQQVRTVYVSDLGKSNMSKALRQEIIKRLGQSGRISVVSSPDNADAVLGVEIQTGKKNVDRSIDPFGEQAVKVGSLVIDTEQITFNLLSQSRALWSLKLDTENFSEDTESKSGRAMADRVSREFLKAVERDGKRRR